MRQQEAKCKETGGKKFIKEIKISSVRFHITVKIRIK